MRYYHLSVVIGLCCAILPSISCHRPVECDTSSYKFSVECDTDIFQLSLVCGVWDWHLSVVFGLWSVGLTSFSCLLFVECDTNDYSPPSVEVRGCQFPFHGSARLSVSLILLVLQSAITIVAVHDCYCPSPLQSTTVSVAIQRSPRLSVSQTVSLVILLCLQANGSSTLARIISRLL